MVLNPLEFLDCLTDSPQFRENLHCHEKELLTSTSKCIKNLMSDLKEVDQAHKSVTKAHMGLAKTLSDFQFEINTAQTDEERTIATAFKKFADNIQRVEQEREKMLEVIKQSCLAELEVFKKEEIGKVKDGKKKFDKQTDRYCRMVERHVGLNVKKHDPSALQEFDQTIDLEHRDYVKATMEYVFMLHGLQEKKKFHFVEIMLSFVYQQMLFLHLGYEHAQDFKPAYTDLQIKLQKTRENFQQVTAEAGDLMKKMLERHVMLGPITNQEDYLEKEVVKQGYMYVLEKRPIGSTWVKNYLMYYKDKKQLRLIPYNQVGGKITTQDVLNLKSCTRRAAESIDKRFCFDIEVLERQQPITLQAISEESRKEWLSIMDGKEPNYKKAALVSESLCSLNPIGEQFVDKCIKAVEARGFNDEGLYRLAGVNSRIQRLTSLALNPTSTAQVDLSDAGDFDIKTITSSLKYYFRHLPEPIMTFKLHNDFIKAAQMDSVERRVLEVHAHVHSLPQENFNLLERLIKHLSKLVENEKATRMTSSNMAVVWGPTLMRRKEETVAAIMDIKFCNVVIEILIDHYKQIFHSTPDGERLSSVKLLPKTSVGANTADAAVPTITSSVTSSAPAKLASLDDFVLEISDPAPANLKENNGGEDSYREARQVLRPGAVYHPSGTGSQLPPEAVSISSSSTDSLNKSASSLSTTQHIKRPVIHPAYTGLGNESQIKESTAIQNSEKASRESTFIQAQKAKFQFTGTSTGSDSLSSQSPSSGRTPSVQSVHSQNSPQDASPATSKASPQLQQQQTGARRFVRQALDAFQDYNTFMSPTPAMSKSSPQLQQSGQTSRRARTLYVCQGENEQELSFAPNEILIDVMPSREPGWLTCTLNGQQGLVPENYIEYLD